MLPVQADIDCVVRIEKNQVARFAKGPDLQIGDHPPSQAESDRFHKRRRTWDMVARRVKTAVGTTAQVDILQSVLAVEDHHGGSGQLQGGQSVGEPGGMKLGEAMGR